MRSAIDLKTLRAQHEGWLSKPKHHVSHGQFQDSLAIVALLDVIAVMREGLKEARTALGKGSDRGVFWREIAIEAITEALLTGTDHLLAGDAEQGGGEV